MSKIRNLFKKFKKKKSDEDVTGEHEISDYDEEDIDIEVFAEEDDVDISDEIDHDPVMATEDSTGDIPPFQKSEDEIEDEIQKLDQEIQELEDDEDSEQEDEVPEFVHASEDETGDIPVAGYLQEDSTGTGTLDLENGKVPLKDRAQDALENIKASMQRFKFARPKKMSIKKDSEDTPNAPSKLQETISKINLPPALKGVEGKLKEHAKKVDWKNIHNEFFSAGHRQSYHRVFQVAGVFLLIYSLGKTTGLILKGKKDYKNLKKNALINIDSSNELTGKKVTELKDANLFRTQMIKTEKGPKKPVVRTNIACKKGDKKSSLPIKLVNTIVMQDSVKSIASVQVRSSNELLELRQNEKISSMAKIDRIERLKLIIKNLQDGSCEYIENETAEKDVGSSIAVMSPKQSVSFKKQQKKIKGIENEGNSFTIDKNLIQEKMTNIQDILTQARGIQITNPDGSLSFKIVDIQPGGIFSYLGIQNNDIITQINGQPISDLNMVMGLFGKITNLNKLNLTIKRNGTETPLDYKFR